MPFFLRISSGAAGTLPLSGTVPPLGVSPRPWTLADCPPPASLADCPPPLGDCPLCPPRGHWRTVPSTLLVADCPPPSLRCPPVDTRGLSPPTLPPVDTGGLSPSALGDCPLCPPVDTGGLSPSRLSRTVPRLSRDCPLCPPVDTGGLSPPTSGTVPRAWNTVAGAGLQRVMADSRFMGFPHSQRACEWGRWIPERNASGGVIGPGRRDEEGQSQSEELRDFGRECSRLTGWPVLGHRCSVMGTDSSEEAVPGSRLL